MFLTDRRDSNSALAEDGIIELWKVSPMDPEHLSEATFLHGHAWTDLAAVVPIDRTAVAVKLACARTILSKRQ